MPNLLIYLAEDIFCFSSFRRQTRRRSNGVFIPLLTWRTYFFRFNPREASLQRLALQLWTDFQRCCALIGLVNKQSINPALWPWFLSCFLNADIYAYAFLSMPNFVLPFLLQRGVHVLFVCRFCTSKHMFYLAWTHVRWGAPCTRRCGQCFQIYKAQ